jgi:hydrogenase maturation protein HypF
MQGLRVHIRGIVQGVGFRPFVYNLAKHHGLNGWVKNTSAGVEIEVDGEREALDRFLHGLRDEAPALSRIDEFSASLQASNGFLSFEILHSEAVEGAFQPISPDVATCPDCLREMFDPDDRRYRYPFINCTNCGPRFTIIQGYSLRSPTNNHVILPMCAPIASGNTTILHRPALPCPAGGMSRLWTSGNVRTFERWNVGKGSKEAIEEDAKGAG